jgi:hypothetical protein
MATTHIKNKVRKGKTREQIELMQLESNKVRF